MAPSRPPRRRPEAPSAPTTLHEITRRYYATALALARAMGLPLTETFMREHRESISCCFIEAGRAGVRLPPAVQLPPLHMSASDNHLAAADNHLATGDNGDVPDFAPPTANGHPGTSSENPTKSAVGDIICSGLPPAPESEDPPRVPPDAGLPCGGQVIKTLKPAQLAMLISKTARLVLDGADQWVPLLHALQAERAARLAKGRKVPDPAHGEG